MSLRTPVRNALKSGFGGTYIHRFFAAIPALTFIAFNGREDANMFCSWRLSPIRKQAAEMLFNVANPSNLIRHLR